MKLKAPSAQRFWRSVVVMRVVVALLIHSHGPTALAVESQDKETSAPPKPNIVLILADDLGYGDVGWLGGPYKTPHLDQLAKQSVRLMQHYSLPVCSPTRAALLSGRFNSRFGCTNPQNPRVFPYDTVTLASALKSVGYDTALIGKWHLGSKPEWGPQKFGFDYSYGSLAGGVTSYTHVYKTGPFAKTWHRNGTFIEEKGHVTDLITQEAVGFITQKRKGPFFLYVPYTAVHLPIDEPQEWLDRYPKDESLAVRQYGACVSHLDDGVGQILAALDKTGVRENTVVLFISDNGGSTGTENNDTQYAGQHPSFKIPARNGPLRGKKGQLYEGGIRTPGLIAWPGQLSARDEYAPIHVADWFPTFARLAGYQPKVDLKWDGSDRWPILTGQVPAEVRVLYWLGPNANSLALRQGDFILICQNQKDDELYNLATDPGQKTNLAAKHPEKVKELLELLKKVRARDNDAKVTAP